MLIICEPTDGIARAKAAPLSSYAHIWHIACHAISHALFSSLVRAVPPPSVRTPRVLWRFQRAALEGKREDESMRQFNKRVRESTAQLLKDEFKEHSSTNKRRKK